MNFSEKIDIENNIVKYVIKARYNEELTDEEIMEIETLHDYVKRIKFSEIDLVLVNKWVDKTKRVALERKF